MDHEEFIARLSADCTQVTKSIIEELDVGRVPENRGASMRAAWYRSASPSDRQAVASIVSYAVYSTFFHFLVELDGVGQVAGNPEEGMYELRYVEGGKSTILNTPDDEELHDLFNDAMWSKLYE